MEEILYQWRLVGHPIICKVFYIPGGCFGFLNHQPLSASNIRLHVLQTDIKSILKRFLLKITSTKEPSLKCVYNKKHALTHLFNRNFPKIENITYEPPKTISSIPFRWKCRGIRQTKKSQQSYCACCFWSATSSRCSIRSNSKPWSWNTAAGFRVVLKLSILWEIPAWWSMTPPEHCCF